MRSLCRAVCLALAVGASVWTTSADAACKQAMLKGKWLMVFLAAPSKGDCVATNYYGCNISVGTSGAFTTEGCFASSDVTQIQPAGNFLINASCHVTGSFAFTYIGLPHTYTIATLDMWLSADKTKVSGFGTGTYSGACENSVGDLSNAPVELISRSPRTAGP